MMKVLLLNPPTPIESRPTVPPLGLAYIAAVLREHDIDVDLIDLDLERERYQDIPALIAAFRPQVVGISGLTIQMEKVYQIAERIKEVARDIAVVVGGPHPSAMPEETLREGRGAIDVVCFGEGEYTLLEVAQEKSREEIRGIAYLKDGKIHKNIPRDPIADIDSLPLPARDMLQVNSYRGWGPIRNTPSTHLIASRGCPFDCIFCSEKAVFGRNHRRRDPKKVVDEIEYLVREFGVREISFYDDLFTLKKSWVIAICDEIERRGIHIDWKALSRVDVVDHEMLARMKRAGCWLIFYGFESGSQTILDNIGKKQTVEQGINAAILTRKAGIDMFGFFMIGNVGETEDTVFKTIRLVKKIRPRYFQCTLARPDPGSDLYKRYIREIGEAHIPWSKYYAFPQDSEGMGAVGTLLSVKELVELRDLMQLSLNRRGLCKRILKLLLRGEISKLIKALRVFLA